MNKICDQHCHNLYSADSLEPIQKYVDKAISLGVDTLVFTNHYDKDCAIIGRNFICDIEAEEKELETFRKKYPQMTFLHGIEMGYKKKLIPHIESVLNSFDFDIINLSIHDVIGIDFYIADDFRKVGVREALKIYFDSMLEAVTNYDHYDVLSHLDYGFRTACIVDPSIKLSEYEDIVSQIMKQVILHDKTFEFNTKVQERIKSDEHSKYLLKLYKSVGGKHLSISSDCHTAERLCSNFDKYIQMVKEAGFDSLDYYVKRKRFSIKI